MAYSKILPIDLLYEKLDHPDWIVMDSRFSLLEKQQGRENYQAGHIPGALYADVETDLSAAVIAGVTGRHPLPDVQDLENRFSNWGIDDQVQVVVYDDAGGAFAARLWWLLRWTGHEAVAVLDGGWAAWVANDLPIERKVAERKRRNYQVRLQPEMAISSQGLLESLKDPQLLILDARDHERYLGTEEPIDPVAGHIPGAVSSPYKSNLNPDGHFKSAEELRTQFLRRAGEATLQNAVVYCGSGVTAAHNVLAMEIAGLPTPRLYAGSWSEWITDLQRPVHTGGTENPDV